jgi:hypothetical protein
VAFEGPKMKILVVLLSVLVVMILSIDLWQESHQPPQTSRTGSLANIVLPSTFAKEPLAIEKRWLNLQAKRELAQQAPQKKKPDINSKTLTIGGIEYLLYGVFNQKYNPFILLKGADNKLVKLAIGQTVNELFVLSKIGNNNIVFQHDNKNIEFKLFEKTRDEDIK